MRFQVELTWRAERDIDDFLTWISKKSSRGAKAWFRRLEEVLEQLATSAEAAVLAPETGYSDTEIRQVVFKTRYGMPYRLLFSMEGDVVYVRHIRGPGQDLVPPEETG